MNSDSSGKRSFRLYGWWIAGLMLGGLIGYYGIGPLLYFAPLWFLFLLVEMFRYRKKPHVCGALAGFLLGATGTVVVLIQFHFVTFH